MQTAGRHGLWLSVVVVILIAGCGPPPPDPANPTEHTMEVPSSSDPGLAAVKPVNVRVHRGDIHVIASDPSIAKAELIEDLGVTDNISESIGVTGDQVFLVGGVPSDPEQRVTVAHLRVPQSAPVNLMTDYGSIYIGGSVGPISATATNGSIEVRGQATGLTNLSARDHILIDGGGRVLRVRSQTGPITIMSDNVTVDAQTDAADNNGAILFVGSLANTSYFTATHNNDVTTVIPPTTAYSFNITTANNQVVAQFPANTADGTRPVTVCGVVDPGPSILLRVDAASHPDDPLGRVVINGDAPTYTGTLTISGTLTGDYFLFTTPVDILHITLPNPSMVHIDTGASRDQQLIKSFMEFDQTGSPLPASGPTTHCPFGGELPLRLFAKSNGGRIRILHSRPFPTPSK